MLELVVFAQEILAEAALENAASEIPDSALALGANHVRQRTRARVSLKTLPTVTNKRLAEVTNGAYHTHACDKGGGMFDYAISSFRHALDFPALTTSRQSLKGLTEVAKGAVFLLSFTRVAFHDEIAGHFHDRLLRSANLLLPLLLLLRLLSLPSFLFRHIEGLSRSTTERLEGEGAARDAARGAAEGGTEPS